MGLKDIFKGLRFYEGLFVGLLFVGLALVALGSAIESEVFIAGGGALLGTSLGAFGGRLSNQDLVKSNQDLADRLSKLVHEGVKDSFVSDNETIEPYRIKWHLYHVTKMKGSFVWRKATLDFTKSQTPGRLTSRIYLLDTSDNPRFYTVEAGIRDNHFIVFLDSETSPEPVTTYVFPFVGVNAPSYYGVVFLETWDRSPAIAPAIISSKVLHDYRKEGTLPSEIGRILDREWRADIPERCPVFPETTKMASLG
jgi:hypothetical protein